MSVKRMISGVVAAAMMLTMQSFAYAEETTFSTVNEFITDVVNVSLTGVTSSTMDTAISDMQSKLSDNDGIISYNGVEIGYWESANSSTLYTDSSKSDVVIEATEDGYEIKPSLLKTLLTDVNNQLIENYVPTSDDWSKIVGKYDITLGDVTIPADQWITASTFYDPDGIRKYLGTQQINDILQWNLTNMSGINGNNISEKYGDNSFYTFAWLIDDSGQLYIQDGMCGLYKGMNPVAYTWFSITDNLSACNGGGSMSVAGNSSTDITTVPYIRAGIANTNVTAANSSVLGDSTNTKLNVILFVTDATMQKSGITYASTGSNDSTSSVLHQVEDPAISNACKIEDAKAYGIVYFTGSQVNADDKTAVHTWHADMFNSYSCSKLVRGNTLITKRIAKLDSLSSADFLTVKESGWYVADGSSIDALIGNQNVINAGDTADINAVAEVESLNFNVIVPTTLPVYIDAAGVVTTATNATVTNKSNASVKMTDITIAAKGESGWTLVQGTPSTVRDAMEFSFTTSLEKDTVLTKDEILPFSYHAELSPLTVGADNLDLATVSVTVDWAD